MSAGARLRELLDGPEPVVAPGAYDCLTARMVQDAGFPAVYMTGAGTAASLGYPDYGLLTMSEMAANAARIAATVGVPVIADADTGFGNELNVVRTVREYAAAGVAALHIEDQVFPKRCGHLDRKQVIEAAAFVSKVRAAAENRPDPDLVLIARTDARAVNGLEDAIERANHALAAGADVAFVEAPQTLEELAEIPRRVEGPCLLNVVAGGRTPDVSLQHAAELGYRVVIVPVLLLTALLAAGDDALAGLAATGRHPDGVPVIGVEQIFRRAGAEPWDEVRARYDAD
ncbi:MAG TPA: isocitrate lyase/PEP mutase family protein [Solirubrobacteraceae bacterium]|jgi:2-methylisocitrate lyase-like PEP mutase family enzyme